MKFTLVCLLAVTSFRGCEMGSPESVARQFQQSLTPYFPNAHVKVLPREGMIAAATCVQGAGDGLVDQVAEYIQNSPDVQQLQSLRTYGPILGNPSYKYVALGFDKSLLVMDVDTWQISYPELPPKYEADYREECGLQAPDNPRATASVSRQYVRIGYYTVRLAQPFRGKLETPWIDSLGVYSEEADFAAQRPAEMQAREGLIRKWFAARHIDVVSITLDRIEKVPL